MGWFTVFKRKKDAVLPTAAAVQQAADTADTKVDTKRLNGASVHDGQGIFLIYNYLQQDFEEKGYHDALTSPDEGYKNDNIRLIRYDLEILIHQVKTYHASLMKDLEFHIHSRSRAGLIDLVDELKIKQTDLLAHIDKVRELEDSLQTNSGLCERAILAYKRGFMKGMASITHAHLLTKKF
ncbi:hypothetical protein BC792_104212 [Sphingobacterium allocomposti]|jgi:hypothetical protein|uniref:Uncharacterized protein n=1 Tax=Sphingobacterium allocomposti TaxID=415956 RepID=A0A5S5DM18_9SPHI|nr:hypothetical protein [Sphingobacterium composti Yoo et al. 2007 non Ten et al. 2007]TYP96980.1 hypothetical protein BC792_104212 [Sphingobacterium composti Yoo et al. 2007 non Ten et al. 2007]HLS94276.1 hypothetical protein [Sphingobacterium sp.]